MLRIVPDLPPEPVLPVFDPAAEAAKALEKAATVADKLLGTRWVREVWLFGSTARGEQKHTSDCDLILVVDFPRYWWVMECLSDRNDYDWKPDRYHVARRELELGDTMRGHGFWGFGLDITVVHEGWRNNLADLQAKGRHRDPFFMQKIARDARLYDPATRTFLPPQR
jgi:hypothetical protein